MFCPKCGGKIKDDNSFCPLCGESLLEYKAGQESGIPQPAPVDASVADNAANPSVEPSASSLTAGESKTEVAATDGAVPAENINRSVTASEDNSTANNIPKMNYEEKKDIPVWIFFAAGGAVLFVLIIIIVAAVVILKKPAVEEPEETAAATETATEAPVEAEEPEPTEEPVSEATATPTPTPEPEPAECVVNVYYGNEYGPLSDVLVEFKKDDQVVYSDTTVNGTLTAKELEPGDYVIRYTGDDLFGDEYKITLLPGANKTETVLLARIEDPEAAYVFITWEGSQDIDACMYNASTGQYVKYDNPIDDMGNFIYQDNNAFRGYEILYVRDRNAEYDHIIYVMDQASVQNGEPSDMEADGLRVRVYTIDGLVDDTAADKEKDAALFSPGSIVEGEFEKNPVYVDGNLSKLAGYEWTQIEKDEPGEETEAASEG